MVKFKTSTLRLITSMDAVKKIYYILFIAILIIVIGRCSIALAADKVFHVMDQKDLPNNMGIYRQIQFILDGNIYVYATILNNNYRAHIYRQNTDNQFFAKSLDELTINQNFLIGINGGFYTQNYQPAGLFIERGITLRRLARDSLLTTCIQINKKEKLLLEKHRENCLTALNAMQTGPLIIDQGDISADIKILPEKLKALKSFFEPHRRTILAATNNKDLIVIVTSPASLYEIAYILKNYPEAFGVDTIKIALDLDGGSSTGMYIRFKDSNPFYFHEQKRVKTMVFFDSSKSLTD